jgi:hypothetical protein
MDPVWGLMEFIGVLAQINIFEIIPWLSGLGVFVFLFNKFYRTFIVSKYPFYEAYTRLMALLYNFGALFFGLVALAWIFGIRLPM